MLSNPTGRSWGQPDRIHGLLFDGAIILANFYVIGTMAGSPLEEMGDRTIGLWLTAGTVAHLLGALLKKGPLQFRIGTVQEGKSGGRENLLGCLSFAHFIFFLIVTVMAFSLLGFIDPDASGGSGETFWILVSFAASFIISWTVWSSIRYRAGQADPRIWWRYQEIPADALLWMSATILTRFFWDALLFGSEAPSYIGFTGRAMVLVTAMSCLFLVFYLPTRLLFLAEDYKYPATWFRLWLVAMLPLISVVFIK